MSPERRAQRFSTQEIDRAATLGEALVLFADQVSLGEFAVAEALAEIAFTAVEPPPEEGSA
jgi:hypothetical protein